MRSACRRRLAADDARPRDLVVMHSNSKLNAVFVPKYALRTPKWKYYKLSGTREELYDMNADPEESINVAVEREIVAGYHRQLLRKETGIAIERGGLQIGASEATEIDPEIRATLDALGYTGE